MKPSRSISGADRALTAITTWHETARMRRPNGIRRQKRALPESCDSGLADDAGEASDKEGGELPMRSAVGSTGIPWGSRR
jgi:hypothetical protein